MVDKESEHQVEHGEQVTHHYVEPPRNKSVSDFIGLKELITLIGFAVTVGMAWSSLSAKIELLQQRHVYAEQQTQKDLKSLNRDVEVLMRKHEDRNKEINTILERIRESEENIRRLWREKKK